MSPGFPASRRRHSRRLPAGAALGATGLEPGGARGGNSKGLENPHSESGADSGAESAISAPNDPGLQTIIDAWPALPPAVKADVLAMVTRGDQ